MAPPAPGTPARAMKTMRSQSSTAAAGGARGEVRVSGRDPIGFGALRRIELRAVNGTCEEAAISVRLAGGASLPLATGHRIEAMLALAREAADLAGVPLHMGGDVAGARET